MKRKKIGTANTQKNMSRNKKCNYEEIEMYGNRKEF